MWGLVILVAGIKPLFMIFLLFRFLTRLKSIGWLSSRVVLNKFIHSKQIRGPQLNNMNIFLTIYNLTVD